MISKNFIVFSVFTFLFSVANAQHIYMKKENGGYFILEGNEPVFFLQRELNRKIPDLARNNYLHPVFDLNGNVITEDFPDDHPHQRGIFWAWHQIIIDGKKVCDGWDIKNFTQMVKNIEFVSTENGKGILKYDSFWYTQDNLLDPILREKVAITTYLATSRYRRIDFEIQLQALEDNMQLGGSNDKKGYGGFSVRMATDKTTKFSNIKGDTIKPRLLAHKSDKIVNITNPESGLAIIAASPTPITNQWVLRQDHSMQNAVWPGKEPVDISVTQPTILKYTVLIHNGDMRPSTLRRIANQANKN